MMFPGTAAAALGISPHIDDLTTTQRVRHSPCGVGKRRRHDRRIGKLARAARREARTR